MTTRDHLAVDEVAFTPGGRIVAANTPLQVYLDQYADKHCEYVEGFVIQMSPAGLEHNRLIYFLHHLLQAYLSRQRVGQVIGQPFVMKLPPFPNRRREPDVMVVLNEHSDRIEATQLNGTADIVIEVVSLESVGRDYGEKFVEYEQGGVREYWIIDPIRKQARFCRLTEMGIYQDAGVPEGIYSTPLLPDFQLEIELLWREVLPEPEVIIALVKAMLGES